MNALQKVVFLYEKIFKPAYADLVSYIGDKPFDILVELENTLSHLFVAINERESPEIRSNNLEKACNHIVRATLDCYKLLWTQLNEDIDEILKSDDKRLSLTISDLEFPSKRMKFKKLAKEARSLELSEVGREPLKAVEAYKKAVDLGLSIINSIDDSKGNIAEKYKFKSKAGELIASAIIGFIIGLLTNAFWNWLIQK